MLGGILAQSGYYTGENSYAPRSSNPLGFFEDARINGINERILEPYDYPGEIPEAMAPGKSYSPYRPRYGHRWLSFMAPCTPVACTDPEIIGEIRSLVTISKPFAYKDPRFSYTLSAWKAHLGEHVKYICIFREPSRVIQSVITECSTADYLSAFSITEALAYTLWHNCYLHILEAIRPMIGKQLIFISYDHFLLGEQVDELSRFLDVNIQVSHVDRNLNRSVPGPVPAAEIGDLYRTLLTLSKVLTA